MVNETSCSRAVERLDELFFESFTSADCLSLVRGSVLVACLSFFKSSPAIITPEILKIIRQRHAVIFLLTMIFIPCHYFGVVGDADKYALNHIVSL